MVKMAILCYAYFANILEISNGIYQKKIKLYALKG